MNWLCFEVSWFFTRSGVIRCFTHFGGIKQYKSMAILRDFPKITLHEVWVGNDSWPLQIHSQPTNSQSLWLQQLIVSWHCQHRAWWRCGRRTIPVTSEIWNIAWRQHLDVKTWINLLSGKLWMPRSEEWDWDEKNKRGQGKTGVGGLKICVCSPRSLGKWSNLTSIFFKWVGEKPPTSWFLEVFSNCICSLTSPPSYFWYSSWTVLGVRRMPREDCFQRQFSRVHRQRGGLRLLRDLGARTCGWAQWRCK